jgi:hypothetical protein
MLASRLVGRCRNGLHVVGDGAAPPGICSVSAVSLVVPDLLWQTSSVEARLTVAELCV